MVFDAVYVLKKSSRTNITHALLDFYDEDQELAQYCYEKVIILHPGVSSDLRLVFQADKVHFHGESTPVIVRMQHARLSQDGLEQCYQLLTTLLITSQRNLT